MKNQWKPAEIIVNEKVQDDPATIYFLAQCPNVPVSLTKSSDPAAIVQTSDILRNTESGIPCGSGLIDPIVPFNGWGNAYSDTHKRLFLRISPERMTLGMLRFEKGLYTMREIWKYSDCPVALCKESANVWEQVGLDLLRCRCACQLDYADMSGISDPS